MQEGPNDSPVAVPHPSDRSEGRPVGITLLAILHFLVLLASVVVAGTLWRELDSVHVLPFAIVFLIVISVAVVYGIVLLASGIGLWFGTKWGWWLAGSLSASTLYYRIFSIAESFLSIDLGSADRDQSNPLSPVRLLWITFYALVIWYLMQPNVLAYFRLNGLRKRKALVILAIGGVVVILGFKAAVRLIPI